VEAITRAFVQGIEASLRSANSAHYLSRSVSERMMLLPGFDARSKAKKALSGIARFSLNAFND
jgi:hypothetical protein